ncbi:MAG: prepilin-type N-terminal cleavage/methylation domain-containing protein [Phycisphaerales bacterium]|nr:MAG: prepilin-type N-terminal cleavage/methylation domain-containing protein [Phycisphaerales bacterium]
MGGVNQYRGGRAPRKAFTLIEQLVVISIVVLLLAILLPALHRARAQARAVACQSNLRQAGIYFALYTEQNDYRFFPDLPIGLGYPAWYEPMKAYFIDGPEVLLCPSANRYRRSSEVHPDWGGGSRSAWEYSGVLASYGTNHWIGSVTEEHRPGQAADQSWETPLIRKAATVPVLLECMFGGGSPTRHDGPPIEDDWHAACGRGCNTSHFCLNRHSETINSLFMDWSVRKVGLKELWTLKWHKRYDTAGSWTKAGGVEREDWPRWMRKFKDY